MPKKNGADGDQDKEPQKKSKTTGAIAQAQETNSSPAANFAQNLVDGKFWGQLLLYPLRQLPEDFDNLSRKIHIVSSTVRTLSAVIGIISGCVAVFYWPWLSGWVSNIVSAYFGETLAASSFGSLLKAYVGGMLVGSVSKFTISDIGLRLINGCVFGNPDYYLTKADIKRLSDKFSTDDIDITEEEVADMGKALISAIESNAPIPGIEEIGGRDVYITIFKNFLAGDISSLHKVIDIQEAVDNQLEEAERKLDELLNIHSRTRKAAMDDDLTASSSGSLADELRHSSERGSLRLERELAGEHDREVVDIGGERDLEEGKTQPQRRLLNRSSSLQPDATARWKAAFHKVKHTAEEEHSSSTGPDLLAADDLLRKIEEARLACQMARNRRRRPICLAGTRAKVKKLAQRRNSPSYTAVERPHEVAIDIERLQKSREEAERQLRTASMIPLPGEHEREVGSTSPREVHVAVRTEDHDSGDLELGRRESRSTSPSHRREASRSPSPRTL